MQSTKIQFGQLVSASTVLSETQKRWLSRNFATFNGNEMSRLSILLEEEQTVLSQPVEQDTAGLQVKRKVLNSRYERVLQSFYRETRPRLYRNAERRNLEREEQQLLRWFDSV